MKQSKVLRLEDEWGARAGWAQVLFCGDDPILAIRIQGHDVNMETKELKQLYNWLSRQLGQRAHTLTRGRGLKKWPDHFTTSSTSI